MILIPIPPHPRGIEVERITLLTDITQVSRRIGVNTDPSDSKRHPLSHWTHNRSCCPVIYVIWVAFELRMQILGLVKGNAITPARLTKAEEMPFNVVRVRHSHLHRHTPGRHKETVSGIRPDFISKLFSEREVRPRCEARSPRKL